MLTYASVGLSCHLLESLGMLLKILHQIQIIYIFIKARIISFIVLEHLEHCVDSKST